MRRLLYIVLSVCVVIFSMAMPAFAYTPPLEIKSDCYVVMDLETGQVLIEKNMNKKKAPASITKILTVALGLEHNELSDRFILTPETVFSIEAGSTHIALTHEEEISLEDAVYATILMSANDAANAVAQCVSGSLSSFVTLMNQKLQELNCDNTHFANPNGLDDPNHYTSAYDMALITRYALSVPGFREVFCSTEYTMEPTNKQPQSRRFGTQHHMIVESKYQYDGAVGGKLGWTPEAHHTIVTLAERDGMSLICVALDSSSQWDKYEDTAALFDYCFEHFTPITIRARDQQPAVVPYIKSGGSTSNVLIQLNDDFTVFAPKNTAKKDLKIEYHTAESYTYGTEIAPSLSVYDANGNLLRTVDLQYTITDDVFHLPSPTINKPMHQAQQLMLTILKCLLVVVSVCILFLFILRFFIRLHYRKRRRKYRAIHPAAPRPRRPRPQS